MRLLLAIIITFSSSLAIAAPKRFNITNRANGMTFMVEREDGVLGELQPEWGKKKRKVECDQVEPSEQSLILTRETEDREGRQVEVCEVDDHFQITETDLAPEIAREKNKREASNALRKKLKDAKDIDKMTLSQLAALVKEMRDAMIDAGIFEEKPEMEVRNKDKTAEALNRLELETKK